MIGDDTVRMRCDCRASERWRWEYGTTTDAETAQRQAAEHRRAGRLVRLVKVEATSGSPLESEVERDRRPILLVAPQLTDRWITAEDGRHLVSWPAIANGWSARTDYHGHVDHLTEVPGNNAVGTGWPESVS